MQQYRFSRELKCPAALITLALALYTSQLIEIRYLPSPPDIFAARILVSHSRCILLFHSDQFLLRSSGQALPHSLCWGDQQHLSEIPYLV